MKYSDVFERALVELEFAWGVSIPTLYCPVTQEPLFLGDKAHEDEVLDYESTATVRFVYSFETNTFDYLHPDLKDAIENKVDDLAAEALTDEEKDEIDFMKDFEILSEYLPTLGETPLVFKVVIQGMEDGPPVETVFIGLDLSPPNQA